MHTYTVYCMHCIGCIVNILVFYSIKQQTTEECRVQIAQFNNVTNTNIVFSFLLRRSFKRTFQHCLPSTCSYPTESVRIQKLFIIISLLLLCMRVFVLFDLMVVHINAHSRIYRVIFESLLCRYNQIIYVLITVAHLPRSKPWPKQDYLSLVQKDFSGATNEAD